MPGLRDDHPAARAVPCDAPALLSPHLRAMVLFEKFGQHQPLNRQSERYAREGIDLSLSTLTDQVARGPTLHALIEPPTRLHGDDTTVPILARGQTIKVTWTGAATGRLWVSRVRRALAVVPPGAAAGVTDRPNRRRENANDRCPTHVRRRP